MHLYAAQVCTAAVPYRSVRIVNASFMWDFTADLPTLWTLDMQRPSHFPFCQHLTPAQILLNNAARRPPALDPAASQHPEHINSHYVFWEILVL